MNNLQQNVLIELEVMKSAGMDVSDAAIAAAQPEVADFEDYDNMSISEIADLLCDLYN